MGVERGEHAAHGVLHERGVVDAVDVLGLHALEHFGEEPRFLPGKGFRLGRFPVGHHTAAQGQGSSEREPGCKGE